jgi:hypothetical protein
MKKLFLTLLAAAGICFTSAQAQTITGTVGTGADWSYLVIEATAFGSPLIYEFRYDYDPINPLTTTDMLMAVDTAFADISFELLYGGAFLNSVTYVSMTLTNSNVPPNFSPFWAQWVSGGESGAPLAPKPSGVWSAGYGPADRTLAPGSWDGFIYNGAYESEPPYNLTSPPPSVSPVPEPGSAVLIICAAGLAVFRRRRSTSTSAR